MSSNILRIFLSALSILFLITSQSFAASYDGPVEKISGKHEIFFKCFEGVMYSAFTSSPSEGAFGAEITCEQIGEDLELNMFYKQIQFPNATEDLNLGVYIIMDKFGKFKKVEPMIKHEDYDYKWRKASDMSEEELGDLSDERYENLVQGVQMIARELLCLVEYKKKKSYKANSIVVSQNLKQNLINGVYLEHFYENITKSQLNQWKNNIKNSKLPKLNFKLVGKINHDGRPAYLLYLKKKIQGASFAGYTIIDQKTGFGLLYKQQHKMGGEDQPGTYVASFSSDENLRSKIERVGGEEKSNEVLKTNEPKIYLSDEERAKRINDFVQKHLSGL